jgi:hypothetical protein
VLVDIGRDPGRLFGRPRGDHPDARREDDPRVGIEGRDLALLGAGLSFDILQVFRAVGSQALLDVRIDRRGIHLRRELEQQGNALRTDDVIGGRRPALTHLRKICAREKRVDPGAPSALEKIVAFPLPEPSS